jgi:hypothetical protein
MFPGESDILMKQAQYADLLKEAETEQFMRAAQLQQPDLWHAARKVIHWLGNQLVKWGTKLPDYPQAPSPEIISKEA